MSGGAILGLPASALTPDPALVSWLRELVAAPDPLPEAHGITVDGDDLMAALPAVVDDALARHRALGIDEEVTRATLQDIGRKLALYSPAAVLAWIVGLLRADVVELGRLQVERRRTRFGHALHIPETGPLAPDAVDASLARARELTGSTEFSCESWLLDPGLQEELAGSNIAAFAARFDVVETGEPSAWASDEVARFVFRRSSAEVRASTGVAPRTRLERYVVDRLRAGDWTMPTGALRTEAG